jgi:hypothetical protein
MMTIRRVFLFAALPVTAALIFGAGAWAAGSTQNAQVNRFDGVSEGIGVCTTTTTFIDIPAMSKSFTVSGKVKAAVVVMFQGSIVQNGTSPVDAGSIRLLVDGVVQQPDSVRVTSNHQGGTNGFNFVTTVLRPGTHTARIQWETDQGGAMCIDSRSLVILHK